VHTRELRVRPGALRVERDRVGVRAQGFVEAAERELRAAADDVAFRKLRVARQRLVGRRERFLQQLRQPDENALDLVRGPESGPGLRVVAVRRERLLEEVNRARRARPCAA
jgi:hypothetical protein